MRSLHRLMVMGLRFGAVKVRVRAEVTVTATSRMRMSQPVSWWPPCSTLTWAALVSVTI